MMITGMQYSFEFLERSKFQFHLTGSRAIGNSKPESDWDFFCQRTEEVERYLYEKGFFPDDTLTYETSSLVMQRTSITMEIIHIQLVDDFEKKLKAQNYILANQYLHAAFVASTKQTRKLLWFHVLSL